MIKIEDDKKAHALVNFAITVILSLLWCTLAAIITAVIVSLAKEVYDEYKTNATGFDMYDLVADGVGIIFGLLIVLTLQYYDLVLQL